MSGAITAAQLLAGKPVTAAPPRTAPCSVPATGQHHTGRSDAKFSNLFAKTSTHIVCTSARLQRQPALVSINLLNGREETKSVRGSFLYIFTKCAKDSSNLLDLDILDIFYFYLISSRYLDPLVSWKV